MNHFENMQNPLAVDSPNPRLSWKVNAPGNPNNAFQTAYQILAASKIELLPNSPDLWDTGKTITNQHLSIKYEGKLVEPGKRIYWTLRVWDEDNNSSSYAKINFWDVAYNVTKWTGQWINIPAQIQDQGLGNISVEDQLVIAFYRGLKPVVFLRKTFEADSDIKQAKIYATAKGLYELFLNDEFGIKVGDKIPLFNPGWTNYNKSIQYQAYDVTNLIRQKNTIGVMLGTGWYSGYVGFHADYGYFGKRESFLMELHIELNNGSRRIIKTDSTWKATTGSLVYADFLQGELYYESKNINGWISHEYDDSSWSDVETKDIDKDVELIAERAPPTVELQIRTPQKAWEKSPGVWIYEFDANLAGFVTIDLENFTDTARIQIRHAEVLNSDGNIYTDNLRTARAIDTYLLDDPKNRPNKIKLKPHFTYHGFRYVEVSGYPGRLKEITAISIGLREIENAITSDNQMVTTLFRNIRNTQTSNFISVPTDCPQRDERLGWMGDAEVFAHTATYNGYVASFFSKWMRDVREAQSPEGAFSNVAPRMVDDGDGGPAWADSGIIVPYQVYRMYGDLEIIEENYESMKKYLEYIWSANPTLLWKNRTGIILGDWLNAGETTPGYVVSTAYFAYDALLLSKMAKAIGRISDAEKYSRLHSDISKAFIEVFVDNTTGKIEGDAQTGYVIALAYQLLPNDLALKAVDHLVENIQRRNWHLTSGFIGVGYILPVLSDYGRDDVAFKLLLQTTYPSWGYMIENNATSMWEHWDGWTKERGFFSPLMNSFNHFSLGSVGRWLYQYMAGIDTDDEEVGFQKIIIKPRIGEGMTYNEASYESVQGLITTQLWKNPDNYVLEVYIPPNTRAVITLPFLKQKWIREVSSGKYKYTVPRQ